MSEGDRERVERALRALAEEARVLLPGRMGEAVAYALLGEGKRVRGLLVLAAHRACGGRGDATGLALAVEVVHAYSLVHDDLPCMDDDDMRRGRPTVHRAFDVATATQVGVVMIPLAARVAWRAAQSLGLGPTASGAIVARLMAASGAAGMVGGQLLDLDAEGRRVGLEELQEIHRGKTGSLITCAAVLGGLGAGAPAAQVAALESYGDRIGLAFQIADDVLDVTATTEELGKTAGRDVDLDKSTYPALLGIEGARALAATLVEEAVAGLRDAGVAGAELEALARFTITRRS